MQAGTVRGRGVTRVWPLIVGGLVLALSWAVSRTTTPAEKRGEGPGIMLAVHALIGPAGPLAALGKTLRPDEWTRLIETGDALRAGGSAARDRTGLSARAAFLLAFHHAQDAGDADRMLAAADRLERLGEADLARHARRVARDPSTSFSGR